MTEQSEQLQFLEQISASLTGKLESLTQNLTDVQSAADSLVSRIEGRKDQVLNLLEQVQSALVDFPLEVNTQRQRLEQQAQALEVSLTTLTTWSNQSQEQFLSEVNQVKELSTVFKMQVETDQVSFQETDEVLQTSLTEFQIQVDSQVKVLTQNTEAAFQEAEILQESLQLAQTSLQSQVDILTQAFENSQNDLTNQIQILVQTHFVSLQGTMRDKLNTVTNGVILTKTEEILNDTEHKIEQELKLLVEQVVDELGEGLNDAVSDFTGRQVKMEGDRFNVRELFDEIDFAIGPLKEAAMGAMSIMDDMGIPPSVQMAAMANPMVLSTAIQAHYAKKALEKAEEVFDDIGDKAEEVFDDIGDEVRSWFS